MPSEIGGFKPDLVWQYIDSKYRFIGEAKTRNDINKSHTRAQLLEYMRVLNTQGCGDLIVAVPWGCEKTVRSLITSIQKKHSFKNFGWHVISNAPQK